jgi:tripartite ATP-independent transporter DctP family solute receptor
MKKGLISIIWLIAVAAMLFAGGTQEGGETQEQEKYVINLAYGSTPVDVNGQVVLKFEELAEKYSNGRLQIEVFENNQLGSEQECAQNLRTGAIQMAAIYTGNLKPFSPSVGVMLLPYMFTSNDQAIEAIDTLLPVLNEKTIEEAGARTLGFFTKGFRCITNSKQPIKSLADLQGVKIRVSQVSVTIETFRAWDIEPVPMAWSEVFTALQQRVVDGQENPHATNLSMKFYEVQKYLTDIHYMLWTGPLLISEVYYQTLPADLQEIVNKAGQEACLYGSNLAVKMNEDAKVELIEKGMIDCGIPVDEAEWQRRARAIWPKFFEDVGGEEWARSCTGLIGISID